jgi:hypothetical protein
MKIRVFEDLKNDLIGYYLSVCCHVTGNSQWEHFLHLQVPEFPIAVEGPLVDIGSSSCTII